MSDVFNISGLRGIFSIDDQRLKDISCVNNNIITKLSVIEGCYEYYNPANGFHCTKEQKRQQPVINLLALVTFAKSIADDVAEILRLLFYEEIGKSINPWRLTYTYLVKKYPDTPLIDLVCKHGLIADSSSDTFYKKIKDLRDTLIHRGIEYTYNSGSAEFSIKASYTSTNSEMVAYKYAEDVYHTMNMIVKEINECLIRHGKACLIMK